MKEVYDVIIVGGGPAGLTAAVYSARYKLNTLVISKNIGGTAATAYKVCNCPSYEEIKGYELMQKFTKQVENLKVPIIYDAVTELNKNKFFEVNVGNKIFSCKKLIFAGGTERIRLNVSGEGKFLGKGISYCATCDAAFFKNKDVIVVGGGNAALTSSLLLAEYAKKVYVVYKRDKLKADPAWIELAEKNKKIYFIFNDEIDKINGENSIEEVILKSGKKMKVQGVFVETGSIPNTSLLKNVKIKLDAKGYIITDKEQKTSLKGLFAAGDITNNALKQIVTASAEGAIAAFSAYKEIEIEK